MSANTASMTNTLDLLERLKMEMPEFQSQTQPDQCPPVRTLKIEADGDSWKGLIKPKIRLVGRWLERAGFRPGNRVRVACLAPGVIELRSPDALTAQGTK